METAVCRQRQKRRKLKGLVRSHRTGMKMACCLFAPVRYNSEPLTSSEQFENFFSYLRAFPLAVRHRKYPAGFAEVKWKS